MADPHLPDRIIVHASHEEDLAADRCAIDLVIESSSFFSGRAALERAVEVREVVTLLVANGVTEDDIALHDVVSETQEGMFTDRSTARYALRATCRDLDRLADVLTEATRPKHTRLQGLTWKYPDDPKLEDGWLRRAVDRANAKADVVADGLGVTILGVYEATSETIGVAPERMAAMATLEGAGPRRRASASDTLDMPVAHTKRAGARVRVTYRISGRE